MKNSITTLLFVYCLCINVSAAVPTWTVEPSNFSNSMVMVGVLNIAGVESLDENDLVAAYVGTEVRGVASLQYEAATDRYIAYLIVYSNTSGDELTFKLYDASADVEIAAQNTVNFVTNGATGNIGSPYVWSDVTLNEGTDLASFIFPESDGSTVYGAGTIEVPVGLGSNLAVLTSSFVASPGSRVTVNTVEQISGTTVIDFSNPVTYHVQSESGTQTADYVVFVVSTNHLPTDILLSAASLDENNAVNVVIGNLLATDDDVSHTFELVSGVGDTDNSDFAIVGNQLQATSVVDFETQNSYSIRIKATDAVNQIFEKAITIGVNDLNETPTGVMVSSQVIGENKAVGTVLASLSATDQDNAETFTYTLTGGLADNSGFSIDASNLITNEAFDFETKNSYAIELTVTDAASNSYQELFTITVADENDAPTALTMDNQTVFENLPFGTVIGNFSAVDQDAGDVQQYTLVSGEGDLDNAAVLISGTQVLVGSALDFESQNQLSIRVEVKDAAEASHEETFLIEILDANDSPTDLLLSNTSVIENEPTGSLVGTLSVVDADPTTTAFTFVAGQNNNGSFTIDGDELRLAEGVDFETQDELVVDVIATDVDNQSVSNRFIVQVADVNEVPTDMTMSSVVIGENATAGVLLATLSTIDQDNTDTFTYALADGFSDNSSFVIDGDNLLTNTSFDFEAKSSYSIELTVTDEGTNTFQKTFSITVLDENDAPLGIGLDNLSVIENLPFGTVIGELSAIDQDANDVHQYTLVSGDGAGDNAAVLISGTQVLVNSTLDFESQNELSIRVEVKDAGAASHEETFLIAVIDANDSPTALLLSNASIVENEPSGSLVGELSVEDVDPTAISYSFVEGENDNASFSIEASEIRLVGEADFETQAQYVIDVLATDIDNQTVANRFTIQIIDENEAPQLINPIGTISKGANTNLEVALASVFEDADSGDELVLSASVPGSTSLPVGVVFDASAMKLTLNSALTLTSFEVVLTATDLGGLLARDTIAVTAEIQVPLGLGNKPPSFSIFPNPVGDLLNLIQSGNGQMLPKHVNIRSLSGKMIQQNLSLIDNSVQVGNLVQGVYLLELKLNDEPIIIRFIKVKK